ncbi:dTDP-4-amino-4,6-dideoxygalactose transaminase [Antarctobacter heliothermus]|uniref:dTDP-4-amino-4,6-dideoxygalactose transaminase n=2 Tax=Antarctobacter heliothermus TaxID=74033 RepID=A0A239D5V0_9RHOB|nr:dTDP-4-amino-4,6-dideoxygalactose transaminase [Antarctobacter heliothermus]
MKSDALGAAKVANGLTVAPCLRQNTDMTERFTGSFTQQEPIPEEAIAAAVEVMRGGRLHRYNTLAGETAQTALLEQEFAAQTGARFCVAVASGGYALGCALRAVGVQPGETVLTNAFTLAPVPGAIAGVGAVPVYVGVTEDLVIDLEDLAAKADRAEVLMLSHMRGHLCDMDRLMQICGDAGITVIEDCAHTMGAAWNGVPSGRQGAVGCFSMQTYKHVNSGEGGLLITDDEDIAARAIMLSGSYMLYERHLAAPGPEVFERVKYITPNISGRMDNLRAAILRPQLRALEAQVDRWNDRYAVVEEGLRGTPGLRLTKRPVAERFVGSSIQFLLLDWTREAVQEVLARCAARGVELKWFGGAEPAGFTSRYDSWRYAPSQPMPSTDRVLRGIVDMRLPLTFSLEDCAQIARIIRAEVSAVFQAQPPVRAD